MKELSILIPTYNDVCADMVGTLRRQAGELDIKYEILVADDGSTDRNAVTSNRIINQWPHCRLIERPENSGRSAIRNFLARQASYGWLLFIDSDMTVCRADYLHSYIRMESHDVIDGGIVVNGLQKHNLRSLYEKASEQAHTAERRQLAPYHDFHTANFMVRRDIMLAHPFDERIRCYGYEDVLFGKQLKEHGISIAHIDNPMSFEIFESNTDFVSKTEEGLRTLYHFRAELKGFSRLLDYSEKVPHTPIRLWHQVMGELERRLLTGSRPVLALFNLYRLGYFISLFHQENA